MIELNPPGIFARPRVAAAALVTLTLVGCATYAPLPLTADAVDAALRVPTRDAIRARIASLHNPLIRAADVDPAAELTPDDAGVIAVLQNPNVRAQRARRNVATAQLLDAGILPNPAINANLDAPFGSNSRGEARGYGLSLSWEITALIARGAKLDAARAAGEQVRLDVAWTEWQTAQAARQAAYDVIALREQQANAERLHAQLDQIATRARQALADHDLTAADASAADAAAQDAGVALAGIVRDLRDAELALNRAMGLPPSAAVRLAPGVALPTTLPIDDVTTLSRDIENRRFDLVALRRGYDSQEASVRAAILGQFPRVALGVANTRDFSDFLTLGPTLAVDVPIFDRNQGKIAIELATREQLRNEYIARVFESRADVARGVALIHSLNDVVATQTSQVAALRTLVDTSEQSLTRGNVSVSAFYALAVSLSGKQIELVKSKQDLIRAQLNLELATGARLDARAAATAPAAAESMEGTR